MAAHDELLARPSRVGSVIHSSRRNRGVDPSINDFKAINRRKALAMAAALGLSIRSADARDAAGENQWIDAHSHIWSPETDRFPLAGGLSKNELDPPSFTDEELLALAAPEGVGRVVLIQHTRYYLFDNRYLLDAVRRRPERFRVVGMVDETKPAPGREMRRLLPLGVTGFRITPRIRKTTAKQWLDTPGMREMWQTAVETRQSMCCLVNADELLVVGRMCAEFVETPVVIDHFGRVGSDGEIRPADLDNLCALARHKWVCVKLSAFYALGKKHPPYLDLAPMIRRLIDAFGPERLMWASDAPYQLQKGNTYAASISLVRDRLDGISPADREWLLQRTAERVFFFG